jgi:hypothetical protein
MGSTITEYHLCMSGDTMHHRRQDMSNIITVVIGTKKIMVNRTLLSKAVKRMEMGQRNKVAMDRVNADKEARKDAFNTQRMVELGTIV